MTNRNVPHSTPWYRFPTLWDTISFSVFAGLTVMIMLRHEPWFDEAQSWTIARDVSIVDLFTTVLRYEGHPPLWYLILMTPAKLGAPFFTAQIISGLVALIGVFVILRFSPFPVYLRVFIPFTFFIFYQYSIVARSYCLFPILLFSIATLHPQRFQRVVWYSTLLCLLALIHVFGMLIAGAFLLIHGAEAIRRWKSFEPAARQNHVLALVLFIVTCVFNILILITPGDQATAGAWYFLVDLLVWRSASILNGALTGTYVLSALILMISVYLFVRSGSLFHFLLPSALVLFIAGVKYFNTYHEGLLFLLFLVGYWTGYTTIRTRSPRWQIIAADVSLGIVITFHVVWSLVCGYNDFVYPYSGGKELAAYIQKNHLEQNVLYAANAAVLSTQPYFENSPYDNYPLSYMMHRKVNSGFFHQKITDRLADLAREKPDYIVTSVPLLLPDLTIPGYKRIQLFDGHLFYKTSFFAGDMYGVYQRKDAGKGIQKAAPAERKK